MSKRYDEQAELERMGYSPEVARDIRHQLDPRTGGPDTPQGFYWTEP